MKLDAKALRHLTAEDFRVLTAVETGSRNHEIVPTPLIIKLSGLRGGSGVLKSISNLSKLNLIARLKNAKYDGYRLAYGGLDYLALNTHQKQKTVYSVGNQIGVGKESDIIVVADASGTQRVLKIHRLGRISFRSIKNNRDYLRHRSSASWMYMSRLAAIKEFAFMDALKKHGFAVPEPIAQNRHTIVMSLIEAFPLRQISSVPDPAGLYSELINMILDLAKFGLIHGDFNEFNILIKEEEIPSENETDKNDENINIKLTPIMIDFPQMVSVDHANADMYFDRDVNCIKRYFQRRFGFVSDEPGPFFSDAKKLVGTEGSARLDVQVEASGFSRKMAKELETYMREVGVDGDGHGHGHGQQSDEDGEESEAEEEEEEEEKVPEVDERDSMQDASGSSLDGTKANSEEAEVDMGKLRISEPS